MTEKKGIIIRKKSEKKSIFFDFYKSTVWSFFRLKLIKNKMKCLKCGVEKNLFAIHNFNIDKENKDKENIDNIICFCIDCNENFYIDQNPEIFCLDEDKIYSQIRNNPKNNVIRKKEVVQNVKKPIKRIKIKSVMSGRAFYNTSHVKPKFEKSYDFKKSFTRKKKKL